MSCAFGAACNKEKGDTSDTSSSVESTVTDGENAAEVVLDKTEIELAVYDEASLSATAYGTNESVAWTSSAPAIVTVDSEGNLVAVAQGAATVTATAGGASATCTVTVTKATAAPVIKLGSEDVYLNIGGNFVSEVKSYWKNKEIEEDVAYTWAVADGAATDVVAITAGEAEVTVQGLKAGTTTLRVSANIRGVSVSKDMQVTVYENDVAIVANTQDYVPYKGYYALDLATADINEYKASNALAFTVYENGKEVDAEIVWSDYNEEIATLDGEKIVSKGAGETTFVGTCTVNGVTANINVVVNVIKPVVALEESTSTLEVENLTALTIQSELLGEIQEVTLFGENVLQSVDGQTITFDKAKMPKIAAELGEQLLYVATETVIYELPVNLYTMIINDADELDQLVTISKNNISNNAGIWDGYFVLGNDIAYNREFIPMTSHNHLYVVMGAERANRYNASLVGWRGVFDGMGYNIDGLALGVQKSAGAAAEAGIFGVINDKGVVRNVSFTNAVARENSGYIAASGGGLIENVSITYKQIGVGTAIEFAGTNNTTKPRIMSSFYSTEQGVSDLAKVRNCFVDASQAKILWNAEAEKGYQWSSFQLAGKARVMENVIVICPNAAATEVSGANYAFNSYQGFIDDTDANAVYEKWDSEYWTKLNGIPFMVNLANNIDAEAEITLDAPDVAFAGRETQIFVNGAYTNLALAEEYVGVTYENGILTATDEAIDTTVTLVLTSYLNDQVVEKEITIKKLVNVTLEQTESVFVEASDTALDISIANAYNGANATVYVGSTVVGEGAITDGKVSIDASLLSDAGYGETSVEVVSEKDGVYNIYDLKVFYVSKVIRTVEDLQAIAVKDGSSTAIFGYYILGNDIDFKGAKTSAGRPNPWNDSTLGFRGVFDGNGKTISNMAVTKYGLFGHIGKGAVIKDVTFDKTIFSKGNWLSMGLLANIIHTATLQNITLNISEYNISYEGTGSTKIFVEQGLLSARYLVYSTIENVTVNAQGIELYRLLGRVSNNNTFTNMNIYAKSYMTIGDSDDQWTAHTVLPEGVKFIAD